MSGARSLRAEQVLARVRGSADPVLDARQRVLASVEQRIAETAGASSSGHGAGAEERALIGRAALMGGAASVVSRRATPAWASARVTQLTARVGRWLSFGLLSGVVGYQLGVRQERAAHHAPGLAAPAPSASALDASGAAASGSSAPRALRLEPPGALGAEGASIEGTTASLARSPRGEPLKPPAASANSTPPARASAGARRAAPSRARRVPSSPAASRKSEAARANASDGVQPLSLAEILERLQRAQAALHDGDASAALDMLDALDALEHGSALLDERRVLRALAYCDLGRVADARRALSGLEGRAESIYGGRLEQSCGPILKR